MFKKRLLIMIVLLSIFVFTGCDNIETNSNNNQENNDIDSNETSYLTSVEWTNSGYEYSDEQEEWLKVAVEIDSYDGDILTAGTYTATQTDGEYDGTPQRVYNLYVTSLDTENPDEVQNNTLPVTVGGVNGSKTEIELEKGQYLYIQKISGGSIGHIIITKK